MSTAGEMARADERREQAAAERAARAAKERSEQLARLAQSGQAPAKLLPLAKADLVTGLEVQLEVTRRSIETLTIFLQGQEAIEGALDDARLAETQALTGKGKNADERGRAIIHFRSLQSVYQADLTNHDKGKEDIVIELRGELVSLNRFYQPLFGRELGARIEAKKPELARTLDPEIIAEYQIGLGTTSIGTPRADALDDMARKSKPVRAFVEHKCEWPLQFEANGTAHLANPRALLDFSETLCAGTEWLLANLSR